MHFCNSKFVRIQKKMFKGVNYLMQLLHKKLKISSVNVIKDALKLKTALKVMLPQ